MGKNVSFTRRNRPFSAGMMALKMADHILSDYS